MTVDVAVVGLNFGAEFAPIYAAHPDVGRVAVVDQDHDRAAAYAARWQLTAYGSLDDLLAADGWDAVHVATPVPLHARHSLAVLRSGRHCACAVPMALGREDVDEIVATVESSGRTYMMMETSVCQREFFYVHDLLERGELGAPTYYRGVHMQNLDGFPAYWMGYPPMAYLTHALSPALALLDAEVERVHCLGSGRLEPHQRGDFGNPFPVETGVFRLVDSPVVADVTMSFFATARPYQEGFSLYGTRAGVEWPPAEDEPQFTFRLGEVPPGHRGRSVGVERNPAPDRADLLPEPIRAFTLPHTRTTPAGEVVQLASHHAGSHPHLVHEFVRSIVERRPARVDARTAAAWTVPGLCAHESALAGGDAVAVPSYRL